ILAPEAILDLQGPTAEPLRRCVVARGLVEHRQVVLDAGDLRMEDSTKALSQGVKRYLQGSPVEPLASGVFAVVVVQGSDFMQLFGVIRLILPPSPPPNLQRSPVELLGGSPLARVLVQQRQIVQAVGVLQMLLSQRPPPDPQGLP